jgi:hypothetical protein
MNERTKPRNARHRDTRDLAFAGYALMKGYRVLRADQCSAGRAKEYTFTFEDPEGSWEALHVEYVNSESAAYDNAIRSLKKLCHRGVVGG